MLRLRRRPADAAVAAEAREHKALAVEAVVAVAASVDLVVTTAPLVRGS